MPQPFFSIVIPTYNRLDQVQQAINSVLKQSYQDFELIISDDGSHDRTGEVVKSLTDPRVKYIYQEKSGVSRARNAGANLAKGNYFIFLDSDDKLSAEYLKRFHEALLSGTFAMAFGYARYMDSSGAEIEYVKPQKSTNFIGPQLAGAFAIDRFLFANTGGYDENLHYSENTEFFLRLKLGAFISPESVALIEDEGVIVYLGDLRERFNTYSKVKYKSANYFLNKHKQHFAKSVNDFVNYKTVYALGAFQNGELKDAQKSMIEIIFRKPLRIKSYVFFLLFSLPWLGRLVWKTQKGSDQKQ
ncbi:MAG TPA: glycosyltransferase [Chryseolinea sp.]|nr:glycosyltransferase [Chryseolinea sp.]